MEASKKRRILMSVLGVLVCGISVGMFKHAALGVDPFQSLMSGLNAVIPISFGTLYVIANVLLLSFSLLLDRTKIGIATVINLLLLGYAAEWMQNLLRRLLPGMNIGFRLLLLLTAIVVMCLASSFYFTANLGVSTYDAVSLILSERQKKVPFAVLRVASDTVCVLLGGGLCLAAGYTLPEITGVIGIGTIITAFFMGPLIEFFNRTAAIPFLYGR